jgi:hypothetical protein
MAHEAFALSPISARATQPSEEDYDAISAAFMETARGRWFLGEFAKRNRNADTHLVLDAVARVEQTLAAQNQPDPDSGRAEALAAIKAALNEARVAAALALDSLALEDNLAPVRKGARIIKEIAWRWREIGADGRICDLIDSQLSAIEASCGHISSADPRSALSAAFDMVNKSIAAFDEDDHAASEAAREAVSSPSSNPWAPPSDEMVADEMLAAVTPRGRTATGDAQAAVTAQAMSAEPAVATVEAAAETIVEAATAKIVGATATSDVTAEAADVTASTEAGVTTDLADMTAAAEAHDDAVLDLIAAEMAAPDPSDDDLDTDGPATYPVGSSPTELERIAATSEASTSLAPTAEAVATPAIAPAIQPPFPASPQPSFEPSPASASDAEVSPDISGEISGQVSGEVSLGSTLIANGIVRRPATSATDPLAAIRRLSQAEKIALFS